MKNGGFVKARFAGLRRPVPSVLFRVWKSEGASGFVRYLILAMPPDLAAHAIIKKTVSVPER
jgi:hypothetical protein